MLPRKELEGSIEGELVLDLPIGLIYKENGVACSSVGFILSLLV